MADEAAIRFVETVDNSGHPGGSDGDDSPLQARAAFIQDWNWQSVVSINCGTCERGRAQHGFNSETAGACQQAWEKQRSQVTALGETFDFLFYCHRRAPFLFFNGNTFAAIGRQLILALFADVPSSRRREIGSAVAHYIAGVLDRESMVQIVDTLSQSAELKPGDAVKTLRGSLRGTVVRQLKDGRVVWRPARGKAELIALPESLVLVKKPPEKPKKT